MLGDKPNQIDKQRPDVEVSAADLLDAGSTPGDITEEGLRNDVSVGFQYISFWLGGRGAAGINNLMEDAATAEISRSQIWQWIRHGKFTRDDVRRILDEEMQRIHAEVGDETWEKGRPDETREIFERVSLSDEFPEFLTLIAYDEIWTSARYCRCGRAMPVELAAQQPRCAIIGDEDAALDAAARGLDALGELRRGAVAGERVARQTTSTPRISNEEAALPAGRTRRPPSRR